MESYYQIKASFYQDKSDIDVLKIEAGNNGKKKEKLFNNLKKKNYSIYRTNLMD